MANKEIKGREDIKILVVEFYAKIREDEMLGPVFAHHIKGEEEWERHMELLTDFWETSMFDEVKYRGSPIRVHRKVNENMKGEIGQEYYHHWLELWIKTIDSLYSGEKVEIAKRRARKLATGLYIGSLQSDKD